MSYDCPSFLPGGIFWTLAQEGGAPRILQSHWTKAPKIGIQEDWSHWNLQARCPKGGPPPKGPRNLLGIPLHLRLTIEPCMHRMRLHDSSWEQPPATCKLLTTRGLTSLGDLHILTVKVEGPCEHPGYSAESPERPSMPLQERCRPSPAKFENKS